MMILGFLAEQALHGYELRRRMEQLFGHARPISYGTVYPAINRLERAGLLRKESGPRKAGAAPVTLHLTDAGRAELLGRLRSVSGQDVTDGHHFMVVLAFLSLLPDQAERDAVLQRRLDFLSQPASFFYDGDRPLRVDDITDPYRCGILISARATSRAERAWLREQLQVTAGTDGGNE
ncbi:Transcriptional regulator PadR-like family protein [Raineyella antarctica]|uniref:Transcriptional regulator PadR-like family protein n=1 Tax=Raineyella antarctica TaxID=1577474 RepID=A0A1G6HL53_9ACTN|nr:PadR family transcriptional regulator [Raineyella antarctica]SDB94979.1 Transcriptional regulator PadR-like family protein [Raineyella antarctica]